MVAPRTGRMILGPDFDDILAYMDWNRVAIEATGRHMRTHPDHPLPICGECLRAIVSAPDPLNLEGEQAFAQIAELRRSRIN